VRLVYVFDGAELRATAVHPFDRLAKRGDGNSVRHWLAVPDSVAAGAAPPVSAFFMPDSIA